MYYLALIYIALFIVGMGSFFSHIYVHKQKDNPLWIGGIFILLLFMGNFLAGYIIVGG